MMGSWRTRSIFFQASFLATLWLFPLATKASEVQSFSPSGSVKTVRQVRVQFSSAMIPFGDPRAKAKADPFDIKCAEKFTTRWADASNWVLDFVRDVPPGVSCEFTLKSELKDLAGSEITGERSFKFSTGGPAIVDVTPGTWSDIENDQAFALTLDGSADEHSIEKLVFFSVKGIAERFGARLVTGRDREAILRANFPYLKDSPDELKKIVIVQATRAFPDASEVTLNWPKGVLSKEGMPVVEPQTYVYKVHPAFEARLSCERDNAKAGCNPILEMRVQFTSPIAIEDAKKIRLSEGAVDKKSREPFGLDAVRKQGEKFVSALSFRGPFLDRKDYYVSLPKNLRDETGRALTNSTQFPLKVRTDAYSPLVKFSSRFGVLELKAEPLLPLHLRNVEAELLAHQESIEGRSFTIQKPDGDSARQIISWLNRVMERADNWDKRDQSLLKGQTTAKPFTIPKPGGARAFEVIGIPLSKPGLHIVEVASKALGRSLLQGGQEMFVSTAALVTDLSVHMKWGRENTLVWVTELSTGKPVSGARVSLRACDGVEIAQSVSDQGGVAVFKDTPMKGTTPSCSDGNSDYNRFSQGLFAFAQKGEDFSFVYSGWDEGLESYRFNLPSGPWHSDTWGPIIAHTVFDRMLYRAGDTVHMKHILREHSMAGFRAVSEKRRPQKLILRHMGSGQIEEFPLKWDFAAGTGETTWTAPKGAKLGTYSVSVSLQPLSKKKESVDQTPSDGEESDGVSDSDYDSLEIGRFRLEEFRIPLMVATVKLPDQALVRPSTVPVDLSIRYLAGGAAKNLPVRLRHRLSPNPYVSFDDYPGFEFSRGDVKEKKAISERSSRQQSEKEPALVSKELKLDTNGGARVDLTDLGAIEKPMSLDVELEFTDPNGEVQTVSRKAPVWPSLNLIGIKAERWIIQDQNLRLDTLVLDSKGKPVAGAPVEIDAFSRSWISHRKRLVGGFYAYEDAEEIKRLSPEKSPETLCKGVTDSHGRFSCETKAPATGEVILHAKTSDAQGFANHTQQSVFVYAPGEDTWMTQGDSDRIDLIPETRHYEPGEKARFQVKTPFKDASALITIEREGVLDTIVQPLSRDNPVIEIPIKGNYAPNVFVSAFLVRGRVSDPRPTALVDLARPSFKMGLTEIKVGWSAHELKVQVKPDRETYRVREKAKVTIQVARAKGEKALPAGAEVAIAAVDEGLLELQPNTSWQLLDAMMGQRPLEVSSSTLQSQVIGKRHFGLKAQAPGGDGGARTARELFDTLLFWKGKATLNSQGEAVVEIPLNDSLTSFHIVAVATAGTDLFGTGSSRIRATKDLMLFSGSAPIVREGDKIQTIFTVRNASEKEMNVGITIQIKGLKSQPEPIKLSLTPGEAKPLIVPVNVPVGITELEYLVTATGDSGQEDSLKVKSKVLTATPERVLQSTITQIEKGFSLAVERPSDAIAAKGGINVTVQAKLGRGLDGVRRYMDSYPFTCLEQQISRAISLGDKALLKSVYEQMSAYMDANGLLKYFASPLTEGSEALTAYVLAITEEAGVPVPESERSKIKTALEKFVRGEIKSSGFRSDDLSARKLAALDALSRLGPIDASMIQSIEITPNIWATSAVLDWVGVLKRSPHLPKQAEHLKNATQVLRSRLNFQGSTMGFSTEGKDALWWLMASADQNAVRLLLTAMGDLAWKEDIPRLVRGALLRQRGGHWDLTTANAWGTLAMQRFSSIYEKDPITGQTELSLGEKKEALKWPLAGEGHAQTLPWPSAGKGTLTASHTGTGRPWLTAQSVAAIPLKAPLTSGYRIKRIVEPIEQKIKGRWSVGDIMRVRLEIDAQADQIWVAISDPVPAGASILGSGLGRDSQLMNQASKNKPLSWPTFTERGLEAFRSYYSYVAKGALQAEYTLRLNSAGVMNLPPTRVEAMYAPEMFGELPNGTLDVAP